MAENDAAGLRLRVHPSEKAHGITLLIRGSHLLPPSSMPHALRFCIRQSIRKENTIRSSGAFQAIYLFTLGAGDDEGSYGVAKDVHGGAGHVERSVDGEDEAEAGFDVIF